MTTVLVIAGLDPSAGAGILADVRVAAEHDVRAVGVVTALTVQDSRGVEAVHPVDAGVLAAQLARLLSDVCPEAVKIGMLGDEGVALAVAHALAPLAPRVPIVWDPVLAPTRGAVRLFEGDTGMVAAALLPVARLVTPNLHEAEALTGLPIETVADLRGAAERLRALGARSVLVKGGHLSGEAAVDVLVDGDDIVERSARRLDTGPLHGTGCVLSMAIACGLARGMPLVEAVDRARAYLLAKLEAPLPTGRGARTLV